MHRSGSMKISIDYGERRSSMMNDNRMILCCLCRSLHQLDGLDRLRQVSDFWSWRFKEKRLQPTGTKQRPETDKKVQWSVQSAWNKVGIQLVTTNKNHPQVHVVTSIGRATSRDHCQHEKQCCFLLPSIWLMACAEPFL